MELGKTFIGEKCPKYVGWKYGPETGLHVMGCKARHCEVCGRYWAWKWRQALSEKVEYDKAQGLEAPSLALTLTWYHLVTIEQAQRSLEFFWRYAREKHPAVQYWGSVEFNQGHTLPHIHFVVSNVKFIDYNDIRAWWILAQHHAHIPVDNIAWVVNIEKIKKNIAAYFTKYITKLTGGKDEVPRRENWKGRYIRYSRKFFPTNIPTMAAFAAFKRQWELGDFTALPDYYVRKPYEGLSVWQSQVDEAYWQQLAALNAPWSPTSDKFRANPVTDSVFDDPRLALPTDPLTRYLLGLSTNYQPLANNNHSW